MQFSIKRGSLAALGVVALVGSLATAGCSAGSLGSGSGGGGSSTEAVTITYLISDDDSQQKSATDLIAAFQAKNPTVTVKLDTRPQGSEGDNTVKTRLATGDMAEVFSYNNGALLSAIKPAQNLADLSDQAWGNQLDETFKASSSVDGKLYGAPFGTSFGGGILYNIPAFKAAGIEVPQTWADMISAADKFKQAGKITPIEQTYGETWTSQVMILGDFHNVAAADPSFVEKYTANQANYSNTPAALTGFEHIQAAREAGYFNKDFASAELNDGIKAVATGQAAMYPMLGGAAASIETVAPGKSNDVGMFAIPGADAATNGLTIWPGTTALYIPKSVEGAKLDAAKKFLEFVTTQEGCDAAIKQNPPQGPFLSKACQLPTDVSQVAKDTQAYVQNGKSSPALEFLSPVKGPNLEQICIQVGTGQATAAAAAKLYDADVKKQAEQLGLPGWS